jgi:hypothetical protein
MKMIDSGSRWQKAGATLESRIPGRLKPVMYGPPSDCGPYGSALKSNFAIEPAMERPIIDWVIIGGESGKDARLCGLSGRDRSEINASQRA